MAAKCRTTSSPAAEALRLATGHPILANGEQQRWENTLSSLSNTTTHLDSSTATAVPRPAPHLPQCVHSTGGEQHVHGGEQDVPAFFASPTPVHLLPGGLLARNHGVGGRSPNEGLHSVHSQSPHIGAAVGPLLKSSTAINANIHTKFHLLFLSLGW